LDVSLLIRNRLDELGLEQKDLAAAAQVTESYVSQLLARKKAPPTPGRTAIYEKIGKALSLPSGELSRLAEMQRREELRKRVADPPHPLFSECRELLLRKCNATRQKEVRRIFEKEPFGELERLVTQTLIDVAKNVARDDHGEEQMRGATVDFLVAAENCASFLDPLIESWNIDLKNFAMEVVLRRPLAADRVKRFAFSEQQPTSTMEPGLEQFLKDASLSGAPTEEEIGFLKSLKFTGKRPTPIYYYRELQNLRDPLHFQS
jgi:transcriptional regulator with XRE-family HTH domain